LSAGATSPVASDELHDYRPHGRAADAFCRRVIRLRRAVQRAPRLLPDVLPASVTDAGLAHVAPQIAFPRHPLEEAVTRWADVRDLSLHGPFGLVTLQESPNEIGVEAENARGVAQAKCVALVGVQVAVERYTIAVGEPT
jgi:hypothetical protein